MCSTLELQPLPKMLTRPSTKQSQISHSGVVQTLPTGLQSSPAQCSPRLSVQEMLAGFQRIYSSFKSSDLRLQILNKGFFFPSRNHSPLLHAPVCTATSSSSNYHVTWWAHWLQALGSPCQHSCPSTSELLQSQCNITGIMCLLFLSAVKLPGSFEMCLTRSNNLHLPTTPSNFHVQ